MEIGFDAIKNMTVAEVLDLEEQYFFEEEYEKDHANAEN